jgi:hypothetical protein
VQRALFALEMGEDLRGELALLPVGPGVFMVSEDGDALGFESGKEIRRVAFPVKDQRDSGTPKTREISLCEASPSCPSPREVRMSVTAQSLKSQPRF